MLQIAIILAWLTALGLMIYLATQALKRRLRGGRRERLEFRKIRRFRRQHRFDEQRRRWVRKRDGVVVTTEAHEDRWFRVTIFGWLLFILGKAIGFRKSSNEGAIPRAHATAICIFVFRPGFGPAGCLLGLSSKMRRQSARLPIELPTADSTKPPPRNRLRCRTAR